LRDPAEASTSESSKQTRQFHSQGATSAGWTPVAFREIGNGKRIGKYRPSRNRKVEFKLNTPGIRRFTEAYRVAMNVPAVEGYPKFIGTPVGYLFEIPEISKEISQVCVRIQVRTVELHIEAAGGSEGRAK
jgi:hypothetical protein